MGNKKIFIAADHAGYKIKTIMLRQLKESGHPVDDLGPFDESRVDYPDFASELCLKLKNHPDALGILVCGSGQGMAMRANKYPFIRAALCWNKESVQLARQHNDANVLCIGARLLEKDVILDILEIFVNEEFEGGRHQARVEKIAQPI